MLSSASHRLRSSAVAEVDLPIFRENVKAVKAGLSENCMMMAVIKSNAYGHGIVPIAEEAEAAGTDRIGVTDVSEGVLLRERGISLPVQLLSPLKEGEGELAVRYELTVSVSSEKEASTLDEAVRKQGKQAAAHLKINTGLNRFGVEPEKALSLCEACYGLEGIYWEGVYTHFSHADAGDWETTDRQFERFIETADKLEAAGYYFPLRHVGASSITLEREDMHLDMVRPGTVLFGYPPVERQRGTLPVQPVMRVVTKLLAVREAGTGESVGYGNSYVTAATEKIGIIPVGLGDGYPGALSNKGEVLVRGKKAKIIGSISLDQTFIKLTDIPEAQPGDEVILIGEQGTESISAREIATWIDSNTDEILASLTSRIARKY